ncbi:hypothetical protein [Synechococcus sp. H70.2]|uniref:hypothetical protein n=1 Tax=unclassified Synechococcus TaxID=2626047 RepID=UPI0039C431E6
MPNRNFLPGLRSSLVSLALASSVAGVMAACSSDTPTATQVPSTISVQLPETAAPATDGIAFYYDGVKTSIKITDAAVLFAACTLETSDPTKIVNFVNNTLKVQPPITAAEVTGLGDPLKPDISDFTGDGRVKCEDAAVLFAVVTVGRDASRVNQFLSSTLKIPDVKVTQDRIDDFFPRPTPTPSPTATPTSTPTPTATPSPTPDPSQIKVEPATLTLPSGSSQIVTVTLPSQPSGNVTVTATPSTGITVTPTTLNFTPTVFSGTVTVKSVAAPGTKGTVKFSASGYTDKVVDVTVGQSSSIVVSPTSLEIPTANSGLKTFNVKLAAAPSNPLTITITPPTGFATDKDSLFFNNVNFNTNQTVTVTTTAPAGTTGVIELFNQDLGQFNVEVKALPAAVGQFFVDPVNGDDGNSGTAAQPFKTLENVLHDTRDAADLVEAAAETLGSGTGGGTDVTVTILSPITEDATGIIASPNLDRGSVTVIGPAGFNFNLGDFKLTLNKGYKLQGFKITSNNPTGTASTAITLADKGTSLKNMTINCKGLGEQEKCVGVTAADTNIVLEGLTLSIQGNENKTVAIFHDGSNTTLQIIGSTIESIASNGTNVVGIKGNSANTKLVVTATTVDFSSIVSGTNGDPTVAIQLSAAGSSVQSSIIKINGTPGQNQGAIGVKTTHTTNKVTIVGNRFTTVTNKVGIGIKKADNGTIDATGNIFPVAPEKELFQNTDPATL